MEVFFVGFPGAMAGRGFALRGGSQISPANGSQKANKCLLIKVSRKKFSWQERAKEKDFRIFERSCADLCCKVNV